MEPNTNIEAKTAKTILQENEDVVVDGQTYSVAPPTAATLIIVSEMVSTLPHVKLNPENLAGECINIAKDCRIIGDIIAVLILGARGLTERKETRQTRRKRRLWGLLPDKVEEQVTEQVIDRRKQLAAALLETYSPRELNALAIRLLSRMELGDFFGLTTFLTEINLIRPTKVETEATQYGQ